MPDFAVDLPLPSDKAAMATEMLLSAARKLTPEGPSAWQLERSIKLGKNGAFWNRFLLGTRAKDLPKTSVLRAAQEMGMPPEFLGEFDARFEAPSSLLLGLEEQGDRVIVKAYLEFWEQVAGHARNGGTAPQLLNIGFKWDVDDPTFSAITEYMCYPLLNIHSIKARLKALFGDQGAPVFQEIEKILAKAMKMLARPSFVYMEATEQAQRLSFDLNIYAANLSLMEVQQEFSAIADWVGPDGIGVSADFGSYKYATLGHLSGGYDRDGELFFTIYFAE